MITAALVTENVVTFACVVTRDTSSISILKDLQSRRLLLELLKSLIFSSLYVIDRLPVESTLPTKYSLALLSQGVARDVR